MSFLRKINETESYESSTHQMKPSKLVELSDTYLSFGNISGMLTNLAYIDFPQLANSSVDIIMKVEESPDQRNIKVSLYFILYMYLFVFNANTIYQV